MTLALWARRLAERRHDNTLRCVAELGYERRLAAAESRMLKAQSADRLAAQRVALSDHSRQGTAEVGVETLAKVRVEPFENHNPRINGHRAKTGEIVSR